MFERLLELPLAQQEEDLRNYVSSLPAGQEWNDAQCIDTTRTWVLPESPDYLTELFCSNTAALCELLRSKLPNH